MAWIIVPKNQNFDGLQVGYQYNLYPGADYIRDIQDREMRNRTAPPVLQSFDEPTVRVNRENIASLIERLANTNNG